MLTRRKNSEMNTEKKAVLVYLNYRNGIWKEFTNEEIGIVLTAFMDYSETGKIHDNEYFKNDRALINAYSAMIINEQENEKKYLKRVEANRINGKKGGRPKSQNKESETECKTILGDPKKKQKGIERGTDLDSKLLESVKTRIENEPEQKAREEPP